MTPPDRAYLLTIDLGTSGPKVALATSMGEIIGCAFEETPLLLLPRGGAEQRPDDWWSAIVRATHRLLADTPVPIDAITAICCTAQWSGTVAIGRDGAPLMNAITWMDTRGAPYIRRITGGRLRVAGYGPDRLLHWIRLTGGAPTHAGKDPLAHILYLKHEHPDIYRQTETFLEPKDYLNLRLTGVRAASYDSITMHWLTDNRNLNHVVYNDRLLALAQVDRAKFPELHRAVDILGPILPEVARELGLSPRTQVIVGTPDIHSAAIGSGAIRDFDANLYIGTSSWLTCHVPFKKTDLAHNMAALPSAIPGRYLLINEQECAGTCLTFLRDNIFFPQDGLAGVPRPEGIYRTFDAIAARTPAGSGGVIFTPWLVGERTPVDDHAVRGGFFNLSLSTTQAQLVRSVFEGVAYNTRWLLGPVERFIGRRLQSINIAGGGANSDIWCQIFADVLGRTINQIADPLQINVRGAALLASAALGYGQFDSLAQQVKITRSYQPDSQHRPIYDRLYREYVRLYQANQPIYARLNRG